MDPNSYEKLHNEIAVMKRLDHPGIVRLYETYTSVAQVRLLAAY
jgi:serine/threonine protein kinase